MSTTGSRDSIYFHNNSLSEMLTEYTHQLVVLLIALPYTLLADLMIYNSIQKNVFLFFSQPRPPTQQDGVSEATPLIVNQNNQHNMHREVSVSIHVQWDPSNQDSLK